MNKLAKRILIALAVLGAVLVLAIFGIGLYVESEGVQARLEAALSSEVRMPVKLAGVHFSPWGGLSATGIAIPSEPGKAVPGSAPIAPYFLEVERVEARIPWGPLFSHQVIIRELAVIQPSVVWNQDANGRWRLPKFDAPSEVNAVKTAAPSVGDQTPVPPGSESAPQARESQTRPQGPKMVVHVDSARIEDATFRFLGRNGEPMAVFEGVTVRCPAVEGREVRGSAVIRKVTVRGRIAMENLSTSWAYVDGNLSLAQVDARTAGGSVRGSYTVKPGVDGTPFTLDLLFDGVDLKRLLTEAGEGGGAEQNISGRLNGCLDLYGLHGQAGSEAGKGQLVLRNGRMDQYPMLQLIGQALQIDELTSLELRQSQLDLRVNDGKIFVDSLVLESPNLSLTAHGESALDGRKLDLASALTINARIGKQLPGWVRQHFQPVEGSDRQVIRFHIGGSMAHPDADLMRVIVGEKIEKQVLDVYRRFMGGGWHKKKGEKAGENKVPPPGGANIGGNPAEAGAPPPAVTSTAPAASGTTAGQVNVPPPTPASPTASGSAAPPKP